MDYSIDNSHWRNYRWNVANNFFVWRTFSVCKSIGDNITDEMTDKKEITDDIFFDDQLLFVIPLVIFFHR
jgi:hypothetical protein